MDNEKSELAQFILEGKESFQRLMKLEILDLETAVCLCYGVTPDEYEKS